MAAVIANASETAVAGGRLLTVTHESRKTIQRVLYSGIKSSEFPNRIIEHIKSE